MKKMHLLLYILVLLACKPGDSPHSSDSQNSQEPFYRGADLSYVNEMLDCGAKYYNDKGGQQDPYSIFSEAGTDLVRVRLWHNPDWTNYSNYQDVRKTIARAKSRGMKVLLDFHYSDDWADPGKQKVPAAWLAVVDDITVLADSLYNYTRKVLLDLHAENLLPEFVQVGNEINSEILQDPDKSYKEINWARNATLINRGIQAVRDLALESEEKIAVMLHIAQPENALWWFDEARKNGIIDYDWIGLSYYPVWSDYTLENLPSSIRTLKNRYGKRVMVVETAYPFTLENADPANNILGKDALTDGFPATEEGQYNYLKALEARIIEGGGQGLIYWEPAWISTSCNTQWGQGSHWDNATLFNHQFQANTGMKYYSAE